MRSLCARSAPSVITDGERLEELGEALRIVLERRLYRRCLLDDVVMKGLHRRVGVAAQAALRRLADACEGERARAARGLNPLADVDGVLGRGDVVELRVEDVLLGERLADAQEQRIVAGIEQLGVTRRGAESLEAPPHGDREGDEHQQEAAEQALGDRAAPA